MTPFTISRTANLSSKTSIGSQTSQVAPLYQLVPPPNNPARCRNHPSTQQKPREDSAADGEEDRVEPVAGHPFDDAADQGQHREIVIHVARDRVERHPQHQRRERREDHEHVSHVRPA